MFTLLREVNIKTLGFDSKKVNINRFGSIRIESNPREIFKMIPLHRVNFQETDFSVLGVDSQWKKTCPLVGVV